MKPPVLTLTSVRAAATTYSFRTEDKLGSWALCTVNDTTGELLITSDWGDWTNRWNIGHLGTPTFTAFLAQGDVDYLARKLEHGDHGQEFSAKKTAGEFKRLLCEHRLEEGRRQLAERLEPGDLDEKGRVPLRLRDRYTPDGLALYAGPHSRPYLTKTCARRLWDEIETITAACYASNNGDLFMERVTNLDGFYDEVSDTPWEYLRTEQTFEDKILRETILPALIAACKQALTPLATGNAAVHDATS